MSDDHAEEIRRRLRKEIGRRLREERHRLRLSQKSLCQAGGIAPQTQINYEAGARIPSADYLHHVAGAGLDIRYVVLGTPSRLAATTDDWAIILQIADLIAEWARTFSIRPSLEARAHLADVFFDQYQTTGFLDTASYQKTLALVRGVRPYDEPSPG